MRNSKYSYLKLFGVSMAVFVGAIALGGILSSYLASPSYRYFFAPSMKVIDTLNTLFSSTAAMSIIIFLKNLLAVSFSILIARRTRGISSALLLILNGLVIGSLLLRLYFTGVSPMYLAAGVLPHGIVEFTGLFVGAALGLKMVLAPDEHLASCKKEVKAFAVRVLVPLLLLAALIEAYITPSILNIVNA